ncbi:MAG: SUMF1/EgtB/PvdO family nonheme iron enzyme, partial [Nitrospirota bacterium]
ANFDKCCDWKGYQTLNVVTAYPDGVSPYGLHNMAGNVREWVADWYNGTYYAVSPTRNPKGPDIAMRRVARGGSWTNSKDYLRVTRRDTVPSDERSPTLGFRCAKSAQ